MVRLCRSGGHWMMSPGITWSQLMLPELWPTPRPAPHLPTNPDKVGVAGAITGPLTFFIYLSHSLLSMLGYQQVPVCFVCPFGLPCHNCQQVCHSAPGDIIGTSAPAHYSNDKIWAKGADHVCACQQETGGNRNASDSHLDGGNSEFDQTCHINIS